MNSFEIPKVKLADVKAALKPLMKKAGKLGCEIPELKVSEPFYRTEKNEFGDEIKQAFVTIEITDTPVKLPGYYLVASSEVTPNGNFLSVKPGETVDVKFRDSECYCDHCKTNRERKYLYIFRDEYGNQVQIGRTCLKDYMGVSPAAIALAATWEKEIASAIDESFGGSSGYYVDLVSWMTLTAAVMSIEGGFVSRAALRAQGYEYGSTSDLTATAKWPGREEKALEYSRKVYAAVTDEMREKATAALEWAQNLTPKTDYDHNVSLIAKNAAITSAKQFGVGSSIYPAYLRHVGWLKEKEIKAKAEKEEALNSEFVGKIGDRVKFAEATVTRVQFIKESEWGNVFLYKFTSPKGEILSWFTGPKDIKQGDVVKLTGTVKEHKVWNEIKETQLGRCRIG